MATKDVIVNVNVRVTREPLRTKRGVLLDGLVGREVIWRGETWRVRGVYGDRADLERVSVAHGREQPNVPIAELENVPVVRKEPKREPRVGEPYCSPGGRFYPIEEVDRCDYPGERHAKGFVEGDRGWRDRRRAPRRA